MTAKEFIEEWIDTTEDGEVLHTEILQVTVHLGIFESEFSNILKLLTVNNRYKDPDEIWYLAKWKKELPCKIDYCGPLRHEIAEIRRKKLPFEPTTTHSERLRQRQRIIRDSKML